VKVKLPGRIIILGCGAVSRCLQTLLLKFEDLKPPLITLIDATEQYPQDNPVLQAGGKFIQFKITKTNFEAFLAETVKCDDVLINLASGVSSEDLVEWSHSNGVVYLDSSVEVWQQTERNDPFSDTIFARHTKLYSRCENWSNPSPTAVLEHGANPGLVSHWVKYGLEYLASRTNEKSVEKAASERDYPRLALLAGVKTIHISEHDRQVLGRERSPGEFCNTWSSDGLREESYGYTECCWGTHEHALPEASVQLTRKKYSHLCIKRKPIETRMNSWTPSEEMTGFIVPHGETLTIGKRLSLWNEDELIYRPTICFIYRPSKAAIESLEELRSGVRVDSEHLMTSDIISGSDDLGVLLMGGFGAIWVGNRLSIDRTRSIVGERHNATVLQVAASLVGALLWAIQNPRSGLMLPGDLPSEFILPIAHEFIGELEVHHTDWRPKGTDHQFSWQFEEFGLTEKTKECNAV